MKITAPPPAAWSTTTTTGATPAGPEPGAFDSEGLARRCGVSLKMIIKHRHKLPGAFRIGRMWRFDRATVEKKLLSGSLT